MGRGGNRLWRKALDAFPAGRTPKGSFIASTAASLALSLVIILIPYVLILQIPGLFSSAYPELLDAQQATTRMAEALNPTYWVVMAMYIGLCGLFQTPNVDRNDMGWFGGLMNNPFSYSDNINRQKFWLLLLMLPGKIMVVTGTATYRLIRTVI